jgi:hypothetical protein
MYLLVKAISKTFNERYIDKEISLSVKKISHKMAFEHDGGKELGIVLEVEWNAIQRHLMVKAMTSRNGQYPNVAQPHEATLSLE